MFPVIFKIEKIGFVLQETDIFIVRKEEKLSVLPPL